MIEFTPATDEQLVLAHSPLLRAVAYTLRYAQDEGGIGLTATSAFKRDFVHEAVATMDWPRFGLAEAYQVSKVLNEHDVVPLQVVHYLLKQKRFARHHKSQFRLTALGREMSAAPRSLFDDIIPYFLFDIDHTSYARFEEKPSGNWDVWMNVMNVELEAGPSEKQLYGAFYEDGPDWGNAGWRAMAAFSGCVLRPLEWAGFICRVDAEDGDPKTVHYVKTPLWATILRLDTDDLVEVKTRH